MSMREVVTIVGKPMLVVTQQWEEMWVYPPRDTTNHTLPAHDRRDPAFVTFTQAGKVDYVSKSYLNQNLVGFTKQEVTDAVGKPTWERITTFKIIFHYSKPDRVNGNGTYYRREVDFDISNRVSSVTSAVHYD